MKRITLSLAMLLLASCVGQGEPEQTDTSFTVAQSTQALDEFAKDTAGLRLLEWSTEGPSLYGVRIPGADATGYYVAFSGCTLDGVKKAFSLYRSSPSREDAHRPDVTITCGGEGAAIANNALLLVDPEPQGYSYLQVPNTGVPTDAGASDPFLRIPNACAGLIHYFDVVERVGNSDAGAIGVPDAAFLASHNIVPLACGNQTVPPNMGATLSAIQFGRSQFGAAEKVFVFRRDVPGSEPEEVYFRAVDGVSINELYRDSAVVMKKASDVASRLGARVLTRTSGTNEELELQKRIGAPEDAAGWDYRLEPLPEGVKPLHRRWFQKKPVCMSGERIDPDSCEKDTWSLYEAPETNGRYSVRFKASSDTKTWEIKLPDCRAEQDSQPNWKSLLNLRLPRFTRGSFASEGEKAATRVDGSPVSELPCLLNRTCTIAIPKGTNLSRQNLKRKELDPRSLIVQGKCTSADSEVRLVLGETVKVGANPFVIDRDTLPSNIRSVRLEGGAVHVDEIVLETPDAGYTGSAIPAFEIKGDIDVTMSGISIEGAGKPTTPAPAIARQAISVTGGRNAPHASVWLNNVHIGTDKTPAFYEGVKVNNATLAISGSEVRAYRRAVVAEQAEVAVTKSSITSAAVPITDNLQLCNIVSSGGKCQSLGNSVSNFPALTLQAGCQAFVADTTITGPLGVIWGGRKNAAADEESGIFVRTTIQGGSSLPDQVRKGAQGIKILGGGRLRFETPRLSRLHTPMLCESSEVNGTAAIEMRRNVVDCVSSAGRTFNGIIDVPGYGCSVFATWGWESSENWPGCAD